MTTRISQGSSKIQEGSHIPPTKFHVGFSNKAFQASANTQTVNAEGVPCPQWMAAIVKRNTEKATREKLLSLGYEAYVATQQETHTYRCRKRKDIERVIITTIVFVRATEQQRIRILKECPYVHYFLTDKAGQANDFGRHPIAVIPDQQMDTLRFMLYNADTPVSFIPTPLRLGDPIRVIRGKLQGLEGTYLRDSNSTHILVTLSLLGSAAVTISPLDIEKIK